MINWADEVKEYREQQRDGFTQSAFEWVESLVPIYYTDIVNEYVRLCSMNQVISSNHVGLELWKVMSYYIFDEYLVLFQRELSYQEEEE